MKKVKFLSAALLAMSLAMLTSCGNKKTSTAEVKIGSGYTTDVIKVNIWDNNQREGLQKIADE